MAFVCHKTSDDFWAARVLTEAGRQTRAGHCGAGFPAGADPGIGSFRELRAATFPPPSFRLVTMRKDGPQVMLSYLQSGVEIALYAPRTKDREPTVKMESYEDMGGWPAPVFRNARFDALSNRNPTRFGTEPASAGHY